MPNVTISVSEDLLKTSREYAKHHGTSLNALIRRLLEETVNAEAGGWPEEFLKAVSQARGNSRGWKWNREDIYRERCGE
ncbi:hypothetical protein HQ576_13295 [bacterium]|nr:hypothetical protein [bacterium]